MSGSSFGSVEQPHVRPRRPLKQYPLHKLLNHLEAESSDELALVKAAAVMRVRLLKRMPDRVTLQLPNNDLVQVSVIHALLLNIPPSTVLVLVLILV